MILMRTKVLKLTSKLTINRQTTDKQPTNNIRNNRKNINNILLADESAKTNTEEDNIQELCMTYIVIYYFLGKR